MTDRRRVAEIRDAIQTTDANADDIAVYAALCERARPPALELGAGAGRFLVALGRRGVRIDGVELDPALCGLAKDRLSSETHADRHARIFHGDMRSFPPPLDYGLLLLPGSTIAILPDEAIVQTLEHFGEALGPGLEIALDVQLRLGQSGRVLAPGGGRIQTGLGPHTVATTHRYDRELRRLEVRHTVSSQDGFRTTLELALHDRDLEGLTHLFRRAGFEFAQPPIDERGAPASQGSQRLFARLRRRW